MLCENYLPEYDTWFALEMKKPGTGSVKNTYHIPLEIGSMDGDDTILNYLAQGTPYLYVSGIESNSTIAGKVILENALS